MPPLDAERLERMALRYVERYATTRARLTRYLARKVRERGYDGEPPDLSALADRFAGLGYIDDRAFAEARAAAMGRRGLGRRRVFQALTHAGVEADDVAEIAPQIEDRRAETAIAYARRRRIGPFGPAESDRELRQRQLAAMIRAGHDFELSRRIVAMAPGESVEPLLDSDER